MSKSCLISCKNIIYYEKVKHFSAFLVGTFIFLSYSANCKYFMSCCLVGSRFVSKSPSACCRHSSKTLPIPGGRILMLVTTLWIKRHGEVKVFELLKMSLSKLFFTSRLSSFLFSYWDFFFFFFFRNGHFYFIPLYFWRTQLPGMIKNVKPAVRLFPLPFTERFLCRL